MVKKVSLGENIRNRREKCGITQQELSKQVMCTQSMLCQIERGSKVPTILLAGEIAKALDCSVDELLNQ